MHNSTFLFILLVSIVAIQAFDDDKKMNPILRNFAQQSRTKPFMHALSSSKNVDGGYRNCYLSPIQCHLPVRREQPQLSNSNSEAEIDEDFARFRRMMFPIS